MMAAPTRRPWRRTPNPEPSRTWIEGPEGSAATEHLPGDRRVVCDFPLFGDSSIDEETMLNLDLIVERVNGGEG